MSDSTIGVTITVDASGAQEPVQAAGAALDKFSASVGKAAEALPKLDAATRAAADAQAGAAQASKALDAALAGLQARLDPVYAAEQRFGQGVKILNAAMAEGKIGLQEYQENMDVLTHEMDSAKSAFLEVGQAATHGGVGTAGFNRELIVLLHEMSQGDFSRFGGSMMVLTERMGGVKLATIGWGIAIVGTAYIIGEAIAHGEEFDRAIGSVQASMAASGRAADGSRDSLIQLVETLRQVPGVSTAAAEEMVGALARQRDIGVGSYVALGAAAAGFARITGQEAPEALGNLVKALDGGYASIQKLDQEYNFLSPVQLDQIRQFEAMGEKGKALDIAVAALKEKFADLASAGLTPMQRATNDLGVAWDSFLGKLGNSGPIKQAQRDITDLLNGMARGLANLADPGNLGALETNLAALIKQRDLLQSDHDGGFFGRINAPQSQIDYLDQQIAKTRELIAAKSEAAKPAPVAGAANGTTDPLAPLKQALAIEQQLGLSAQRREEAEGRIAQLKLGAAQAAKLAEAGGDQAAQYQAQANRLLADAKELQTQLDNEANKGVETRLQRWQEALNKQLLSGKIYGEAAKAAEVNFWSARLAEAEKGSADYREVEQRLYAAQSALHSAETSAATRAAEAAARQQKAEFDGYVEGLRDKQAALKGDFAAQEAIEDEILALMRLRYGEDSKAYGEEVKKRIALKQEEVDQQAKIAEIAAKGAAERAKLAASQDAGRQKSDYDLLDVFSGQPQQDADKRQGQLQSDYTQQQTANVQGLLSTEDPVKQQEIYQQILTAQQNFAIKSKEINEQSAAAVDQAWTKALAPVEKAFESTITGILQHGETLRQSMVKIASSIETSLIDAAVKAAGSWVKNQLIQLTSTTSTEAQKTAATIAGNAARLTSTEGAQGAGKASMAAAASGSILTDANTAAAGAFAAVASIPYVGPFLAPVAAATAFTAVMAYDVISAEGGMGSVPFDDMPALLHRNEMVLPSNIASPLRAALGNWGMASMPAIGGSLPSGGAVPGGGAGGDTHLHYAPTIHGGGADLATLLRTQGSSMHAWLRNQHRNGVFRS